MPNSNTLALITCLLLAASGALSAIAGTGVIQSNPTATAIVVGLTGAVGAALAWLTRQNPPPPPAGTETRYRVKHRR